MVDGSFVFRHQEQSKNCFAPNEQSAYSPVNEWRSCCIY
ncbi:hypothetical protein M595_0551 [Lyngbya aestuarii BL J]|uniref:Uncharacterized protein n=1 Tax=Lyngbya aestuarii BL J TaxID=1348334 RepID=U7QQC4_9CYAN|nr:hypothetical protein M595_0551 [Lyngbya aestuarii BL J]